MENKHTAKNFLFISCFVDFCFAVAFLAYEKHSGCSKLFQYYKCSRKYFTIFITIIYVNYRFFYCCSGERKWTMAAVDYIPRFFFYLFIRKVTGASICTNDYFYIKFWS